MKFQKPTKQQLQPKTPNTPKSPFISIKKQQHVSRQQLTTITNQNNLNTSSLLTSAFSRRKSFDINASLCKPLKYQPHVGKIKPMQQQQPQVNSANQSQLIRRKSIILTSNKPSKNELHHDQMRLHSEYVFV